MITSRKQDVSSKNTPFMDFKNININYIKIMASYQMGKYLNDRQTGVNVFETFARVS